MGNRVILIVGGLEAAFFGLQFLRILPTAMRLGYALARKEAAWPGPAVHDPDIKVAAVNQWLGKREHLFPFFLKYAGGVLAAFLMSGMTALNVIFWWIVPQEGKEWFTFGFPLVLAGLVGLVSVRRVSLARRIVDMHVCR